MHTLHDTALLALIALLAVSASIFTAGFLAGMGLAGWLKKQMLSNRNPK